MSAAVTVFGAEFLDSLYKVKVARRERWPLLQKRINCDKADEIDCDAYVLSPELLILLKLAENVI